MNSLVLDDMLTVENIGEFEIWTGCCNIMDSISSWQLEVPRSSPGRGGCKFFCVNLNISSCLRGNFLA